MFNFSKKKKGNVEIDCTIKAHSVFQHSKQAEPQFTAFNSIFQPSTQPVLHQSNYPRLASNSNGAEKSSQKANKLKEISICTPINAQYKAKTSENTEKAAHPIASLPQRFSASNQSPPTLKQPQKDRFSCQITQTTSANYALAYATPLKNYSSPILASQNQNSRANSTTEVIFAALPAAPTTGILYDVINTANASDCKVTAFGNTGDAPKQNTTMGGLANHTTNSDFLSMESDSVHILRQPSYAPLNSTPLEKSSTFSTAPIIPPLSSCASITPVQNKKLQAPLHQIITSSVPSTTIGTSQKLVARSLVDLPISKLKSKKLRQLQDK